MKNFYEILEVNENASQEVIERIYKLLAKKYHPDLNPDNPKEAEEKFKEISEAYETLSNSDKRKEYDDKLKLQRMRSTINNSVSHEANTAKTSNVKPQTVVKNENYRQDIPHNETSTSSNAEYQEALYKQQLEYIKNMQAEKEYQMKKAYNDAYINAMKSMGFEVVYKVPFRERLKTIFNIILTVLLLCLILYICWNIPYTKSYMIDFIKQIEDILHISILK